MIGKPAAGDASVRLNGLPILGISEAKEPPALPQPPMLFSSECEARP
jgi:hypothetical protein